MNPVQYTANRDTFERMRDELNVVLAFSGAHLGEDGKVRFSEKAHNLTEAEERVSRLRSALVFGFFVDISNAIVIQQFINWFL